MKERLLVSFVTSCLYLGMSNWSVSLYFGQMLQGIHPGKIVQVETLPSNFPVTEDMVEGSLEEGKSLSSEIKAMSQIKQILFLYIQIDSIRVIQIYTCKNPQ